MKAAPVCTSCGAARYLICRRVCLLLTRLGLYRPPLICLNCCLLRCGMLRGQGKRDHLLRRKAFLTGASAIPVLVASLRQEARIAKRKKEEREERLEAARKKVERWRRNEARRREREEEKRRSEATPSSLSPS